jgi:hypothetical protein
MTVPRTATLDDRSLGPSSRPSLGREKLDMPYSEEALLNAHRHCVLNAAEIASSE